MKVLIASEFREHYLASYCARALGRIGHDVVRVDTASFPLMKKPLVHRIARIALGRKIVACAKAERPDVFLAINGKDIHPLAVKQLSSMTTTVNWWVDFPELYEDWKRFLGLYAFAFTPTDIRPYERAGIFVRKLPLAVDSRFIQAAMMPAVRDVCFVGTGYRARARILGALHENGINVDVFGTGWTFPSHPPVTGNALFRTYQQSAIGLNIHQNFPAGRYGANMRTFEIPASMCFQLVDYREDLDDLFKTGKEVACYRSERELAERVRYYLDNDSERKRIARAGNRRVRREHTYEHRMRALMRMIR